MRFDQLFLDDIRERVPISSIIGTRVAWDRKKTNASRGDWWACCPFHGEKSPSFHCEDRKGRYHCFGCGVTGDHFRFLVELEGLAFPEAVARVAEMAGMALPAQGPRDDVKEQRRAGLHDVTAMAAQWFEEQLQSSAGAKARAYLRERGLSGQTQAEFRLGYAPESRSALKTFLAGKGVTKDVLDACGLLVTGEDIPVSYDRFRDRVMFPIDDSRGRPIAFGGRALAKDVPAKYLNSPETDLFSKGRTLYNLARARKAAQEMGRAGGAQAPTLIAVEGYMDVIALAQAGIANAVAPLGTALTEDQLDMLLRVADEPVLSFDGDAAGLRAAHRAVDLALPRLKPGKSVRFAILPGGQDPDDVVRLNGREAFDDIIARARPLSDMLWSRETQGGQFDTPERRAELEGALKRLTALIPDDAVRRHYAQDMRERMQAFFGPAPDARRSGGRNGAERGGGGRAAGAAGRLAVSDSLTRSPLLAARGDNAASLREAALLVSAVHHPALVLRDFERFEVLHFTPGPVQAIRAAILDRLSERAGAGPEDMVEAIAAKGLSGPFAELETRVRNARLWPALPEAAIDDAELFFEQAAGLHRRIAMLRHDLKLAESDLAENGSEEGFAAFVALREELNRLQQGEALVEGFGVLSGRASKRG